MENSDSVVGSFTVSGKYRINNISINEEVFEENIPFDITLDSKYDASKVTIDIDDFYYEIINDEFLRVHIDVLVDNLVYEKKEVEKPKEIIKEEREEISTIINERNDDLMNDNVTLSDKKEDNFCLGVSMGAFGTLAWALRKKDYFKKVACVSGYYDFSLGMSDELKKQRNAYILVKLSRPYMMEAFSEGSLSTGIIKKEKNAELIGYGCYQESANLIKLIESARDHDVDVDLYCGDNDQISLEQSKFFFKHLKEHGFNTSYTKVEGVHDVYAWRKALVLAFEKFFCKK